MRGDSYAWVAAQQLHEDWLAAEFNRDMAWAEHVNDALTVLEGGDDDDTA